MIYLKAQQVRNLESIVLGIVVVNLEIQLEPWSIKMKAMYVDQPFMLALLIINKEVNLK